eukprot:CAMPEP_0204829254 /NCGR_PEP_ID=MMETSP1346-20131115/7346_1 /ASSEMBLY_ACC=CAM_ASM_000771 /TAXON_ID=215587 /ORGANISM="Aplanochytrium stocchinoi, Strain GSBS06" /LENGTH=200 /DNA_ID=CAMNT_0051958887 /DNA_START=137 /DNA_END=739 /DNA_ORIENTATION=+
MSSASASASASAPTSTSSSSFSITSMKKREAIESTTAIQSSKKLKHDHKLVEKEIIHVQDDSDTLDDESETEDEDEEYFTKNPKVSKMLNKYQFRPWVAKICDSGIRSKKWGAYPQYYTCPFWDQNNRDSCSMHDGVDTYFTHDTGSKEESICLKHLKAMMIDVSSDEEDEDSQSESDGVDDDSHDEEDDSHDEEDHDDI